jgi:hypothetical protein
MKRSKNGSRALPSNSNLQPGVQQQQGHSSHQSSVEPEDPEPPVMQSVYTNGNLRHSLSSEQLTVHDWIAEREKMVFDDGTMTFFWYTVLILMS